MEWMVPLRRLDEAQQTFLKQCAEITDKPKWIEGFAGSGKTVLLVHAIQFYVQRNPESRVCVVVFTHALKDLIQSGINPEFLSRIPVMTYLNFVNNDKNHYNLVVVDEVQDVPVTILKAIRKKTDNLLVGGDYAQSIYESGSGADQIEEILDPDRLRLPMVYRLTRKIINVVKNILPDNNIVADTSRHLEETQVTLAHAESKDEELSWVWNQAKRFTETGHPSVVVMPGHPAVKDFINFAAKEEGIKIPEYYLDKWGNVDYGLVNQQLSEMKCGSCLQYLGNGYGTLEFSDSKPVIYVMTYHSVKGLDFRSVFLPLLTSDTIFWNNPDIDRRLFFVGATRSRRDLFMSYHGKDPHPYIKSMPQDELHKIELVEDAHKSTDDDFIF